jgi:hypothetical protein
MCSRPSRSIYVSNGIDKLSEAKVRTDLRPSNPGAGAGVRLWDGTEPWVWNSIAMRGGEIFQLIP